MDVPRVYLGMFLRKKKNKSGSTSVQIISKERGKYKVVKTIGNSDNERILYREKSNLSIRKTAELTHNMYQITYTLPESKHTKTRLLKMDEQQAELFQIIEKNF